MRVDSLSEYLSQLAMSDISLWLYPLLQSSCTLSLLHCTCCWFCCFTPELKCTKYCSIGSDLLYFWTYLSRHLTKYRKALYICSESHSGTVASAYYGW